MGDGWWEGMEPAPAESTEPRVDAHASAAADEQRVGLPNCSGCCAQSDLRRGGGLHERWRGVNIRVMVGVLKNVKSATPSHLCSLLLPPPPPPPPNDGALAVGAQRGRVIQARRAT
jgi:hypothetical protein